MRCEIFSGYFSGYFSLFWRFLAFSSFSWFSCRIEWSVVDVLTPLSPRVVTPCRRNWSGPPSSRHERCSKWGLQNHHHEKIMCEVMRDSTDGQHCHLISSSISCVPNRCHPPTFFTCRWRVRTGSRVRQLFLAFFVRNVWRTKKAWPIPAWMY